MKVQSTILQSVAGLLHSVALKKLMRAKKTMEAEEMENAEAVLDRAVELVQLFTEATLLTAGFHTHCRQWRQNGVTDKVEETRAKFRALLDKTNKAVEQTN